MRDLYEIFQAVADLALPRPCIVCGKNLLLREKHLCIDCQAELPLTYNWKLSRNQMADRFNELIQRDIGVMPYAYGVALFIYSSHNQYSNITKSLKYHYNLSAGRFFAEILVGKLRESPLYADVDLVIPVPLHWTRRWQRGHNQAEDIGLILARGLGVKMVANALQRVRKTKTQTHLDVMQKARNVSGAFRVREKYKRSCLLSGAHHILIVDDVFTTGATVHACHMALRTVIPSSTRVSVATLACVHW